MRLVACSVLLLTSSAGAADFRGVDFGTSCDIVDAHENALGSRKIPGRFGTPLEHRFTGYSFGREVVVLYLCDKDGLRIGSELYHGERFDDVAEHYRAVYARLASLYGPPADEWSERSHRQDRPELPHAGGENQGSFHASWLTAGLLVRLDLARTRDQQWLTGLVVSRARFN